MADVHNSEVRSYNMSQIKGKDTKPEVAVRKYLFSHGFRYRKNVNYLPGRPDIVLRKYRTCIFVNGCFWHKHEGCRYFVWPKSNVEFWEEKIKTNVSRDETNYLRLKEQGWNVIVVWECELKAKCFEKTMSSVVKELNSNVKY